MANHLHNNETGAQFTLYPDRSLLHGPETHGKRLADVITSYGGPAVFLNEAHHHLKKDPLHMQFAAVRTLFQEGYGQTSRLGAAFEDGALIGGMIVSASANRRLMSDVVQKVETTIEMLETQYYGTSDAASANQSLFSEIRMRFIRSIRDEGARGFRTHGRESIPIVPGIGVTRYNGDQDCMDAIAEGIGFVISQLEWAYNSDYHAFADTMHNADRSIESRARLRADLADTAMQYLALEPRKQT